MSPIVLYHATWEPVPADLGAWVHNVTPEEFVAQARWLKANFDVVSIDDWFQTPERDGKACITFDDGYRCIFESVIPELISMRLPCTVFLNGFTFAGGVFWRDKIRYLLTTQQVGAFLEFLADDNQQLGLTESNFYKASKSPAINSRALVQLLDRFFSQHLGSERIAVQGWCATDEQQLLCDPLVVYGSHSFHHFVLASLTPAEQAQELDRNQAFIDSLSVPCTQVFAIPFGGTDDTNTHSFSAMQHRGVAGALFSRRRLNTDRDQIDGVPIAERFMAPPTCAALEQTMQTLSMRIC